MTTTATPATTQENTMKALTYHTYGTPDVLELHDVDTPTVGPDDVLVRVHAASVNPVDWHYLTGTPYIVRLVAGLRAPRRTIPGSDLAGTVDAVGANVTRFRPGDEVFGWRGGGTIAEYAAVPADQLVSKPPNVTFEQAAGAGVAAFTALQGLRDKGQLQSGHKVLINGASGGVGTFAVQIAKAFGAHVTAVCSTRNTDIARSIGADEVIDYTKEDFIQGGQRYDLLFDIAANRSLSACRSVLTSNGVVVLVGGGKNPWVGPLPQLVKALLQSKLSSQRFVLFIAKETNDDLVVLRDLLEAEKVTTVIDRAYGLSDAREAFRYLEEGHAQGKIVITM